MGGGGEACVEQIWSECGECGVSWEYVDCGWSRCGGSVKKCGAIVE